MTFKTKDFLAVARLAAEAADDKKAADIRLLDVRHTSGLADYYLLASVQSAPQLQAVQDNVDQKVKEAFGLFPLHREGRHGVTWLVMDYGGLVIHLMHQATREFYSLERLWEGAKVVEWQAKAPEPKAKKPEPKAKKPAAKKSPSSRRSAKK